MHTEAPSRRGSAGNGVAYRDRTLLGPACPGLRLETAARIGDTLWMAGGGVGSVRVIGFDSAAHRVASLLDVPGVSEVWGAAASGSDLYLAVATPAELIRIDTTTMIISDRQPLDDRTAWAVTVAPDGEVLVGTAPAAGLWAYHPESRSTRQVATVMPAPGYLRSLVATQDHVYCATGPVARLLRVDRATGRVDDLEPPGLDGQTFVRICAGFPRAGGTGDLLALGTTPQARLVLLDPDHPSRAAVAELPHDEPYINGLHHRAGRLWITSTRSNALWCIDEPTQAFDAASQGSAELAPRLVSMTPHGATALGSLGDGRLWVVQHDLALVDPDTGEVELPSLDGGQEHRFDATATLAWIDGTVHLAGESGVLAHHDDGSSEPMIIDASQVESFATLDGRLHLGGRPLARIMTLTPGDNVPTQLAQVPRDEEQRHIAVLRSDPARGLLVAGTRPDYGARDGALVVIDPRSGDLAVERGILAGQAITAIAPVGGGWCIGGSIDNGEGTVPTVATATVGLVAADGLSLQWETTPVRDAREIVDVRAVDLLSAELGDEAVATDPQQYGSLVVGITDQGHAFGLDSGTGSLRWRVRVARSGGRMARRGTTLYGTDGRILWALDLGGDGPPTPRTVLTGLHGVWSGPPTVVTDDSGALFTVQENHRLRIDGDPGAPTGRGAAS